MMYLVVGSGLVYCVGIIQEIAATAHRPVPRPRFRAYLLEMSRLLRAMGFALQAFCSHFQIILIAPKTHRMT
jgi:hypothetical protein